MGHTGSSLGSFNWVGSVYRMGSAHDFVGDLEVTFCPGFWNWIDSHFNAHVSRSFVMRIPNRFIGPVLVTVLVVACGGDEPIRRVTAGDPEISVTQEPPGSNCLNGGMKVEGGNLAEP